MEEFGDDYPDSRNHEASPIITQIGIGKPRAATAGNRKNCFKSSQWCSVSAEINHHGLARIGGEAKWKGQNSKSPVNRETGPLDWLARKKSKYWSSDWTMVSVHDDDHSLGCPSRSINQRESESVSGGQLLPTRKRQGIGNQVFT